MAAPKKDQRIPVMMSRDDVAAIDDWRRRQADVPSRSEAIRRLVEPALAASRPAKHLSPNARVAAASYAEHAAGETIDETQRHSGQSKAVKAERKKRLTRLPPELAKRARSWG
jgi:metal-responsive CopG/Arc/MetJ family transcriptional regulator